MQRQIPIELLHLNNIVHRLSENTIDAENAVEELTDVNPESELGKALTDLMTKVAIYNLLDFYLGYDRVQNVIKVYFSKSSEKEMLQKLADAVSNESSTGSEAKPIIQSKVFRTKLDPKDEDFKWVLELDYIAADFNAEYSLKDVPVKVDLAGELSVGDEADIKPEEYSV